MAKTDLKINYGELRGIHDKLTRTADALRQLESASRIFSEVLMEQEGASFSALNTL